MLSPNQPNMNQNPDSSNNYAALLITESEALSNPPSTIEANTLTVDTSFPMISYESFIEKGETLKGNTNATKYEGWANSKFTRRRSVTHITKNAL